MLFSKDTFSSFISPILKIPWCTIIKYDFQFSIPADKSISNYRYFTYNESQEFETKDTCTDLFFRLFCLLAIQSFVSFVYLISVKQFKKSFIESLFVAKIHSCYGTLLWFIYFDYCSICQCVSNTWLFIQSAMVGVWIISSFLLLWYSHTGLWPSWARLSLGSIPRNKILKHRAYECSNLEGHRQCQHSS